MRVEVAPLRTVRTYVRLSVVFCGKSHYDKFGKLIHIRSIMKLVFTESSYVCKINIRRSIFISNKQEKNVKKYPVIQ